MDRTQQQHQARCFLALHHDPELLVLPNIWDPLGARLLVSLGFPAVATASAAVAFSLGLDDGERIDLDTMLEVIGRIARSVEVPLTADIESGYAEQPDDVAGNVKRVIEAGAVGINLEDSIPGTRDLYPIDMQCARLRAARRAAAELDLHLVINARIDVFFKQAHDTAAENLQETIARAKAYIDAGADCVFPLVVGEVEMLKTLVAAVGAPINVYATKGTAPARELETIGISRLSVGPGLLQAGLTAMRQAALELRHPGTHDLITRDAMSTADIRQLLGSRHG
jgi:2-methylisocitrate lyase-like PEP mutase family enzyme